MAGACAIIVCDHGLGHLRRCALMAKELEKSGGQVTLFAPRTSVERLQRVVPSIVGLNIVDFATQTSSDRLRKELPDILEWLDRLPDIDDFDMVICDNLPEILALRPDATISAQFFWHDVIEDASSVYAEYCKDLLDRHKPTVIGCELFAMDDVRRQPGFKPVGLYQIPELVAAARATPIDQRTDLLITGGTTNSAQKQLKRIISEQMNIGRGEYRHIYVDEELLPRYPPDWIMKADFTLGMYCRLNAAVCRPGLGVITDLLTVGAKIYPIYEDGNFEMIHNANILRGFKYSPFKFGW